MSRSETLRVIHVGAGRNVLKIVEYTGSATRVAMPFRQIVADALHLESRALIVSHNHPSGDATPSRADIEVTKRLAMTLATLDVRLHDHLIFGDGHSTSFRALGLL